MRARALFLLFGLIGGQSIADEAREADVRLDFATRGLDFEFPLMLESIDNLTNVAGLPARIEIDREGSWWDIDIRETEAIWVYDGYSVLTVSISKGSRVTESSSPDRPNWITSFMGTLLLTLV